MADDCALAGYYSRLLGILLSRSAEQILGFLKVSLPTALGTIGKPGRLVQTQC